MKKVVFITPYGGNTGSEIMIYSLFKSLQKPDEYEFYLFSCQPGKILEFEKNNPRFAYFNPKKSLAARFFQKIRKIITGLDPIEQDLLKFHHRIGADFWYINTLILPWSVDLALKKQIDFTVHFHELPSLYQELSKNQWQQLMNGAKRLVVCSDIVGKRLRQSGYTNPIHLVNECIDTQKIQSVIEISSVKTDFSPDAKIWVGSGITTYRKGMDILADILEYLPENYYILWAGKVLENGLGEHIQNRSKQEFGGRLIFTGELNGEAYYNTLKKANGFLLTSREDPYPLVMLEAAALGLPIVSYNSGGVSEFVQANMGIVFDHYSAKNFADAMLEVDNQSVAIDRELLVREGMRHDVEIIKQRWLDELKKILS